MEESTTNKPVNIYAESTPNPEAMKFVANFMLLHHGIREYESAGQATDSPFAQQLFSFTGVKGVFITANFVTVTKQKDADWYDIMNIIREFIRGYLQAGDPVFTDADAGSGSDGPSGATEEKIPAGGDAAEQQIIELLENYVRPAVEQDGGAIRFKSFRDGVVTVVLQGSCSGCPSSTVTLKSGIENLLTRMMPEVKEVVAEEG